MFGSLFFLFGCSDVSKDASEQSSLPLVEMETSMGSFIIALDVENAPATCENWLQYVDSGFYDGTDGLGATIFHRVIEGFVVQGGGYTPQGELKETLAPIVNEAVSSGLSNTRGTIAMARTTDPNSATSQFYVNMLDNFFLDPSPDSAGYAVFGTVTEGMNILDDIATVSVDESDKPAADIIITAATVLE